MNRIGALLLTGMLIVGVAGAHAQSAPNERIRGTIAAFDGHELRVQTREGNPVALTVPDSAKISALTRLRLRDVKKGSFVGITAVLRGPGSTLEALEVHVFPESMRGTGEGHYDWDLRPGSTMTNANVDAIVTTRSGKVLTLGYKDGSQKIIVPKGTPIVTFTPSDKSRLMPGAPVFVIAQPETGGGLDALRILVGSDGLKPPM